MIIEDLSKYNTMKSLLDYENKADITYNKMFLKSIILNSSGVQLLVNSTSFAHKYDSYIMQYTRLITLTDTELIKYRYSPKLYCYDKYGTMELWALLLHINNMTSCTEFKKNTIRVFNDNIFDVINEILVDEEDRIAKNNEDLNL